MENIRTEKWNGHDVRFIERDGEWWAVAKDICDALGYENSRKAVSDHCTHPRVTKWSVGVVTGTKRDGTPAIQIVDMQIINELDIYSLIFQSRLPEAKSFRQWVFEVVKELRKAFGLQGYEAWRVVDKSYQRGMMDMLHEGMEEVSKKDYIKANAIADKAIASMYGLDKSIKKEEMAPDMLRDRQPILEKTVKLMLMQSEFGMDFSVSKVVYKKFASDGK